MREIIRGIEQGSEAWHQLRLGIPTASAFSRILTAAKLQPSTQQEQYIAELNAEWVSGEPCDDFGGTEWVERGKALEPEARREYAFEAKAKPEEVAFIYKDESHMVGCSPDALVGEEGLLELKCPMLKTHMFWLNRSTLPREHLIQVQGQIWCADAKWCDFMSYFPETPAVRMRIEPDPKIQAAFDVLIPDFLYNLENSRRRLREKGCVPASDLLAEPDTGIPVSDELPDDAPIPERDEPPDERRDSVDAGMISTFRTIAKRCNVEWKIVEAHLRKNYRGRSLTVTDLQEISVWIEKRGS